MSNTEVLEGAPAPLPSRTPQIYAALAKAQGEMKNASLNKVNPHFKSRYADLAEIRDATVPILARHNIACTQEMDRDGAQLIMRTRLTHADGSYVQSETPFPNVVEQPQKLGSAATYLRRYQLAALCGISADEDDDGNEAQKGAETRGAQKQDNGRYKLKGDGPASSMTELRKMLNGLVNEVRAVLRDEQHLNAIMEDNRALVKQGKDNLPEWWDGKDDWEGFGSILNAAYERCREQDTQDAKSGFVTAEDLVSTP